MAGSRKSAARLLALCLGAIVLCLAGALADSYRAPEKQITARLYATGVHAYRLAIRPVSSKWVRCPFIPTCSEYSAQAVKRHGIRKGLWLTIDRLHRCRTNVRIGTFDPVPWAAPPGDR
ncbi:MAG: membrane protein insertion efficiency factor YidD [Verrucomicrobiota bacterium]